jgi:hypothetical protein
MGRIWIMRQICVILVCHEYGHVWVEELRLFMPETVEQKYLQFFLSTCCHIFLRL